MKSREGSGQKEEHEQRLRGKKYHGGLGDIQVLLIQPKLTPMAGNEIMVPDYGGVGSLSYMFMFLFVWPIDSLQQHLLEYLQKCRSKPTLICGK